MHSKEKEQKRVIGKLRLDTHASVLSVFITRLHQRNVSVQKQVLHLNIRKDTRCCFCHNTKVEEEANRNVKLRKTKQKSYWLIFVSSRFYH